jgi:hypothetical protein
MRLVVILISSMPESSATGCLSLLREGMFIATALLLRWQSDVLAFPAAAYARQPDLFNGITQSGEIWWSLGVQLVFEIITDTVCMVAEARRGLNPVVVWRHLPKAQLMPAFLLMSVLGGMGGAFRTYLGDYFDACNNKDMCYCVNNGLRPEGVLEAYCRLLYPNSSGVPGAATTP